MTLPTKNAKNIEMPWVHVFLIGETGGGKTTAAATFPKPYFIVPKNEQSIITLMGQDVDYIEVVGKKGKPPATYGLEDVLSELEVLYNASPDDFPYDTIVIESLSHYLDLVVEDLTRGSKLDMDWSKWGVLSGHLRNVQARLRNLDVHVVFTSLAEFKGGGDNGQSKGEPLMQGRMKKLLPAACDIIGFCECIPGKPMRYVTHLVPHKGVAARSRFRGTPARIENFSFAEIEPYISGKSNQK